MIVGRVDVPCKGPGSDVKKSLQRNMQFTGLILRNLEELGPGCACFLSILINNLKSKPCFTQK